MIENLYDIAERRKFVALPANTKKSNRALAKEMGISDGTVRGDRKWLARSMDKCPAPKANNPKTAIEPRINKPYAPSNVAQHRARMLAVAKQWLVQVGVVLADVDWIVIETSKQLSLYRIEFSNLGPPTKSPEFLLAFLRPIRKVGDYMPEKLYFLRDWLAVWLGNCLPGQETAQEEMLVEIRKMAIG